MASELDFWWRPRQDSNCAQGLGNRKESGKRRSRRVANRTFSAGQRGREGGDGSNRIRMAPEL